MPMLTDASFSSIDDVRRFARQVLDPHRSAEKESLRCALAEVRIRWATPGCGSILLN